LEQDIRNRMQITKNKFRESLFPRKHLLVLIVCISLLQVLNIWNLWKLLVRKFYVTGSTPVIFLVPIALFLFLHAILTSMKSEKTVSLFLFVFCCIPIVQRMLKPTSLIYYCLEITNQFLVVTTFIIILSVLISRKLKTRK